MLLADEFSENRQDILKIGIKKQDTQQGELRSELYINISSEEKSLAEHGSLSIHEHIQYVAAKTLRRNRRHKLA